MNKNRLLLISRCVRYVLTLVLLYHVFYEAEIATWLAIAILTVLYQETL